MPSRAAQQVLAHLGGSHLGGVTRHVERATCCRGAGQGGDCSITEVHHHLIHRYAENLASYLGQRRRLAGTNIGNGASHDYSTIHLDTHPGLARIFHPADTAVALLIAGNTVANSGSLGICWPFTQRCQGLSCTLI